MILRRCPRGLPAVVLAGLLLATAGCGGSAARTSVGVSCAPASAASLVPADGAWFGAHLDDDAVSDEYAGTLGERPAVTGLVLDVPLGAADRAGLVAAAERVARDDSILLLTLEPRQGLAAVTAEAALDLAVRLDAVNHGRAPVVVRFAPEMNGHWYDWGQQPTAYVAAFRRIAAAVHAEAPGSATMWAPAYGGGYPFTTRPPGDGATAARDAVALDVDGGGTVTRADDPYAPYWPGADAVDWVGLSLFHWGSAWPWGQNEVPEPGKFLAQLTGKYVGPGGDDRALPDFYAVYGEGYDKPVAIPETGALYAPGGGGAAEGDIKRAWWRQVLDPALAERLPRLAMVAWVERSLPAGDGLPPVDWRALAHPDLAADFREDLPPWARWADDVPSCTG